MRTVITYLPARHVTESLKATESGMMNWVLTSLLLSSNISCGAKQTGTQESITLYAFKSYIQDHCQRWRSCLNGIFG